MKMNVFSRILFLFIFMLASVQVPVKAQETAPGSTDGSIPSNRPSGETVTYDSLPKSQSPAAASAAADTADVLLIQTSDPWEGSYHYVGANWYDGVTSDTMVLDTLGYTYEIATWDDINAGTVNIFSYPVVLIVNDQVQSFYDSYAAHVTDFETYVSNGHTLLFFAAGYGWAYGQLQAPLPAGVRWSITKAGGGSALANYNTIIDTDHPIVTATLSDNNPLTNADLYSNYASHGYFYNLTPQTNVILRESYSEGYNPTLIEYRLGLGRVIASTLTWEHSWSYHTGADGYGTYARKALDDVFLYALSGGAVPSDVTIDLRVEDAPSYIEVSKSRGSTIDIIARVSGSAGYPFEVTLTVPSDRFGNPTTTFTRNHPGNPTALQQNAYTEPATGQYRVNSVLSYMMDGKYYKEVVWRFTIPTGAGAEEDISLAVEISVPNYTVQEPEKSVQFNIIDYARSLIITNRQLLFSKYGSDPTNTRVPNLLEHVYLQAYVYDAEVFYVDRYNADARTWDQDVELTSEATANGLAVALDGLLEGWYTRLTKTVNDVTTMRPEYLLILGGDEIIPFYRVNDDNYENDEISVMDIDADDPVGRLASENYFLSDNIYADVGGGLADWEDGDLELSTGRILGHSAEAMLNFMNNGLFATPKLTNAVMASRSTNHDVEMIRDSLTERHVTLYGETNPTLVENDQWTQAQWRTALEQDYQLLTFGAHGFYDGWYGTNAWGTAGVTTSGHPAGQINKNHPLFVVAACNFAIPTDLDGATWNPEADDNISYKLIDLGASGIVSSTAINTTAAANDEKYGEWIYNHYVQNLMRLDYEPGIYSERYGTALLKAKQDYTGTGWFGWLTSTDKKALLEYVYYGLPWSVMEIEPVEEENAAAPQLEAKGYQESSQITQSAAAAFSKTITLDVGTYNIASEGSFEILQIPGLENTFDEGHPVLPIYTTKLVLPAGSSVTGLTLVNQASIALGAHNIPAANPGGERDPDNGYTSVMSVTGLQPSPRFNYNVQSFADRVEVLVGIHPATFMVETHALTLYTNTTLRLDYDTPVQAVLEEVGLEKPRYTPGESAVVQATVGNIGEASLPLSAVVEIYDGQGNLVNWTQSGPFIVNGNAQFALEMSLASPEEPGSYRAAVTLYDTGTAISGGTASFDVLAGKISSFTAPASLKKGVYGTFTVNFQNYRSQAVDVSSRIIIYNSAGVDVSSMLQRNFSVAGNASGSTSWNWNSIGLRDGTYTMQAVVNIGSEWYISPFATVQLYSDKLYLPLLRR